MNLDQCAYEFSHKIICYRIFFRRNTNETPNNVAPSTPVFRHLSVCDTEEQTSSGVSRSNTPQLSNTSGPDSSDCSSNEPSGRIRRKRQRRYDEWKDIKRKRLKNLGKAYLSRNGVLRDGKILKPPHPITCRLKCYQKFNAQDRNRIFTSFWQIGDHCRQWDYIVNHTKVNFTNNFSRRKKSIKYCLPLLESNSDIPNKVSVCRTMFLNTLSVGERTVQTALAKWRSVSGSISPDRRGRGDNKTIVIDDVKKQGVLRHVKSFKPVGSHYVRKKSTKIYLDSDLTFPKIIYLIIIQR
ncbi:unnamed protein product [Arctia plantaginis]|uniref:Uncharacterized protein n=1 Tax=Arctia plantaginis TaxID=874455 RepID=A0A8S1AVD4_ARCPL|nr:unnamed protein product [Arctia plantaginis]